MKAIILAAGYATRLYPLTRGIPKALLPIGGKPILEHTLEKLSHCTHLNRIYIVTNNRYYGVFERWREKWQKSKSRSATIPATLLNDGTDSNDNRLGSIGDILFAIDNQGIADDLLILCSDKLFEFDLCGFIAYFLEHREALNICYDTGDREKIRGKHGCVVLDHRGIIIDFQEKPENPTSTIESIAFYIYPARTIPLLKEYLESGGNPDAPGYLLQWISKRIPVRAYLVDGDCHDVGTVESYNRVDALYGSGAYDRG